MEFSTRQRPIKLDKLTIYDIRYVAQYGNARFISANSINDLKDSSKYEIGKELEKDLLREDTSLLDPSQLKILIHVSDRMYHVLLDTIPLILKINKLYPEIKFVLYLRGPNRSEETNIFHECLVEVLEEIGADYFLIYNAPKSTHSPIYKVANFIYLDYIKFDLHQALSLSDVEKAVKLLKKMYVGDAPRRGENKKIYLTRPKYNTDFGSEVFTEDGSYKDDARIDDENKLIDFFSSQGYEIVAPETKFSSFAEQVQYMSEVEVMAAVSSSGLTNALFMEPGARVIEILAEVVTPKTVLANSKLATNQKLPAEYFPLSFLMGHTHLMISTRRNADKAINDLKVLTDYV